MSEVNLGIVVESTDINFSVTDNTISFTPEGIQMNIFAGGAPIPAAPANSVQ